MTVLAALALVAGSLLVLTGAIGVLRFPDLMGRLQGESLVSIGTVVTVWGCALRSEDLGNAAELLLAGAFILVTTPLSAHLVARAVHGPGPGSPDDGTG